MAIAIFAAGATTSWFLSALLPAAPRPIMEAPKAAAQEASSPAARVERRTPVVEAAELASPSVVAIEVSRGAAGFFPGADLRGEGSGVLINPRGYLLTNYHVVRSAVEQRPAAELRVRLVDGRTFEARVVADSQPNDLAVLHIVGGGGARFPCIHLGSSNDLLPGETVVALGNPYRLQHTVSSGVISAVRRAVQLPTGEEYSDFIQTDAAINPGNSGGPLINVCGELIGLNTAIYSQGWGIAFAIPVDRIKELLADYVEREHAVARVEESEEGVRIVSLDSADPAATSGLEVGDVIEAADGRPLRNAFDFIAACLGTTEREPLLLRVRRDGSLEELSVGARGESTDLEERLWNRFGIRGGPGRAPVRGGIRFRDGFFVEEVAPSGPAAQVDVRAGDLLFFLGPARPVRSDRGDGTESTIRTAADILAVPSRHPGVALRVGILRDGRAYEGELRPADE